MLLKRSLYCLIMVYAMIMPCILAAGQGVPSAKTQGQVSDACSRPAEGSVLQDPAVISSVNGLLKVTLTVHNSPDRYGHMRYCYSDEHGNPAPTLRLQPGDTVSLTLKNAISQPPVSGSKIGHHRPPRDPCSAAAMPPSFTNLHFHGLVIPPVCHQDETVKTANRAGNLF